MKSKTEKQWRKPMKPKIGSLNRIIILTKLQVVFKKQKSDKTQITKIKNKRGITTDLSEIKRVVKGYYMYSPD